jgi:hypothetical protein
MLRLLKLCFALAGFVCFAWFGSTVKLGPRTLFEHLRAIGQTKESQDLVDGTKQAAEPLVDDVRRRIAGRAAPAVSPVSPDGGAPEERVSDTDKRQLRHLIGAAERTHHR